jgi:hypothetical protein
MRRIALAASIPGNEPTSVGLHAADKKLYAVDTDAVPGQQYAGQSYAAVDPLQRAKDALVKSAMARAQAESRLAYRAKAVAAVTAQQAELEQTREECAALQAELQSERAGYAGAAHEADRARAELVQLLRLTSSLMGVLDGSYDANRVLPDEVLHSAPCEDAQLPPAVLEDIRRTIARNADRAADAEANGGVGVGYNGYRSGRRDSKMSLVSTVTASVAPAVVRAGAGAGPFAGTSPSAASASASVSASAAASPQAQPRADAVADPHTPAAAPIPYSATPGEILESADYILARVRQWMLRHDPDVRELE